MASYKTCVVPLCRSTTIQNPEKLFIHVPKSPQRRKKWLLMARRDSKLTSDKCSVYFCEDHFDLPNDMENYIRYRVMGSISRIRMKAGCLPSKFECQPDRIKRTAPLQPRSAASKRRRMEVIKDIFSYESEMPATAGTTVNSDFHSITNKDTCDPTNKTKDMTTQVYPEVIDKIMQVCLTTKIRSKSTQTINQAKDENTSPLKTNSTCTATSPIEITKSGVKSARFENTKVNRRLLFNNWIFKVTSSNSSSPSKHSHLKTDTSLSVQSSLVMTSTSSDPETQTELSELKRKVETEDLCRRTLEITIHRIKNNPRYYIGIPNECYFLIQLIQKHTKLPEEHILICLKKIRLNTPFCELGDQFGISQSYASEIFMKSVPFISSVLHPFIIKSNKRAVVRNLPLGFRDKYNNIDCIIDCFEIEIQQPSKSVEQALTWSDYKKANTAKYLISSTPDGVINYISPGYSGRITDVFLFQDSNFLHCLEPGASILADRGFKHLEEHLVQKEITLVRPPSVSSNAKLSKQDLHRTKQILSLRIHIERVIRRLREFSMLKPHSVVNKKLLKYLDQCTIIACGLINLQNSIIKTT